MQFLRIFGMKNVNLLPFFGMKNVRNDDNLKYSYNLSSKNYNFGYNTINYIAHRLAFLLQMQQFLPICEQFILWKTEKLFDGFQRY